LNNLEITKLEIICLQQYHDLVWGSIQWAVVIIITIFFFATKPWWCDVEIGLKCVHIIHISCIIWVHQLFGFHHSCLKHSAVVRDDFQWWLALCNLLLAFFLFGFVLLLIMHDRLFLCFRQHLVLDAWRDILHCKAEMGTMGLVWFLQCSVEVKLFEEASNVVKKAKFSCKLFLCKKISRIVTS
jgi:hypothetical protein